MNEIFFRAQIDKLANTFTPKAFDKQRTEAIRHHTDGLTDQEFEKITRHFVNNFRQAPLPNDFREAAQKERGARPRQEFIPLQRSQQIECSICEDLGVVCLAQPNIAVLGLCKCKAGNQQTWKLPKVTRVTGYKVTPMPWEFFKPEIPLFGEPKTNEQAKLREVATQKAVEHKVGLWRDMIRVSEEYWVVNQSEVMAPL